MAMQIDKGSLRKYCKPGEKKFAKKQHKRQKRRKAKDIEKPNPQHNRYTDGWVM